MPFATSKTGNRIYYEVYGEGTPIILIHGNPLDHWIWLYQIPVLSRKYKVVAPDLRSYGGSDICDAKCSISDLSDDIIAVCNAEQLDSFISAGLSIGASVAFDIAYRFPERVKALLLAGVGISGKEIQGIMQRRIEGFRTNGFAGYLPEYLPELFNKEFLESSIARVIVEMYLQNSANVDIKAITRMYEALGEYEIREYLPKLQPMPVAIITAEHDAARFMGREISELIPGSVYEVIAGGSHCACMDSPEEFNTRVMKFIENL